MPKIESEKIDCLHRPCSRPAPRGKIESVRRHSEVIEQFDSFSLLKLLFLVRNWHCWSRKAFPRQMTPQSRGKTAKTAVLRHRWQASEKLYGRSRLYASAQGRHETGGVLSLFSRLSFDISIKNSVQRWSSDFQGLFLVKIRKMAQGSDDLSLHRSLSVRTRLRRHCYVVNVHATSMRHTNTNFVKSTACFTGVWRRSCWDDPNAEAWACCLPCITSPPRTCPGLEQDCILTIE